MRSYISDSDPFVRGVAGLLLYDMGERDGLTSSNFRDIGFIANNIGFDYLKMNAIRILREMHYDIEFYVDLQKR